MANELAVIDHQKFPALVPGSEVAEALEANKAIAEGETREQDLVKITVPSQGQTQWTWTDMTGNQSADVIRGLLVWVQKRGYLWPFEEPSGDMPVLVTNDMFTAEKRGDELGDIDPEILEKASNGDGSYAWKELGEYQEFGSSENGHGKRCREYRMLFILQEGGAHPCMVPAPPGSLKTILPFITQMCATVPHWRAVIELSLEKDKSKGGVDFSRIVPKLVGMIDAETGKKVKEFYTDPIAGMAHRVDFAQEGTKESETQTES